MNTLPFVIARNRALLWQAAALTACIAPHMPRQPLPVTAGFALLLAWRLLGAWRGWPLPDHRHRLLVTMKNFMAVGIFAAIYFLYGRTLGREAGVSLLIVLSGLKLLEMQSERERYLLAFLSYFLVITNFFYTQGIPAALLMVFDVWLVTASLIVLNDGGGGLAIGQPLRLSGRMLAQALPLTLAAFVLFPRLPGPLWGLPKDAHAGVTGLSEEMSPGNISSLSLADTPAFRVEFVGTPPAPAERYWRGPVLTHTDGVTWRRTDRERLWPPNLHAEGNRHQYTVTLEPHNQRWLFLLELPAVYPQDSLVTRDLRVLARKPVTQRLRYTAQSYPNSRIVQADDEDLTAALDLPGGFHPRTVALARQWRSGSRSPDEIIRRALQHFRDQPFFYALTATAAEGDTVDDFLFNTRRGFCEHYASAFTILMRAAGIPARVVTGYQGGEYNPVGGYLLVRSRDAHAWTEVWIAGRGWTRVDPTGAVAPSRIERGIDTAIPPALAGIPDVLEQNPAVMQLWRTLRDTVDAVNNRWNLWVIGYNTRRQSELLSRLGVEARWSNLTIGLTAIATLIMATIAVSMLLAASRRRDPVRAAYDRFCARLARAGLPRPAYEGPFDFATRAARRFPRAADRIFDITALYVDLRYGANGNPETRTAFRQAIRVFRV